MGVLNHIGVSDDELARQARTGDADAALMLARRLEEDLPVEDFISEVAQGRLSFDVFDLLVDSFDRARSERVTDELDELLGPKPS